MRMLLNVDDKTISDAITRTWGDGCDMRDHLTKLDDDVVSFLLGILDKISRREGLEVYALMERKLIEALTVGQWAEAREELKEWEEDN